MVNKPIRNTGFSVPCTEEEKEDLRQKAVFRDMTISAYVRWVLKNYPQTDNALLKEAEQDG
jgi:hypothetical protein